MLHLYMIIYPREMFHGGIHVWNIEAAYVKEKNIFEQEAKESFASPDYSKNGRLRNFTKKSALAK